MKYDLKLAGMVLLAISGAWLASMQEASAQAGSSSPEVTVTTPAGSADLYLKSSGRYGRVGDLIGRQVVDQQNRAIGRVTDLITDVENGRVPLAIVTMNNGKTLTPIPPQLLVAQPGQTSLKANLDSATLSHAPSFAANNWPDVSNPQWASSVYSFYGQPVWWQAPKTAGGPEIREPAGAYRVPIWISGRDRDQQADEVLRMYQQGKIAARVTDRRLAQSAPEVLYPEYPATAPNRTETTSVTEPSGAQTGAAATPSKLSRTTSLLGATVKDAKGETVGTVKDVVVDWPQNRISYAVITPVQDLGARHQFLALPPVALTHSQTDPTIYQINVDRAMLAGAPGFEGTAWPEPSNQTFLGDVYKFYGQTPYWTPGTGSIIKSE